MSKRSRLASVVAYPDRGPWGDASYRGNCSGYLLIDLWATYRPLRLLDPMEGGGTSREVCADLQTLYAEDAPEYAGFDLRDGVDSLVDPIGSDYDLIFWHPPYHSMIVYTEDERDLSRCPSVRAFAECVRAGYERFSGLLAPGGRLAILMGDMRKHGRYYPFGSMISRLDDHRLEGVVIKQQFNMRSNDTRYPPTFVPIVHETLAIYRAV
ncbi:DNA modification methylase [Candidatus Gracilibacteria bacterium]|nr:DNA modification methylase [Candidatus Gracilibacteria bacterium]